MFFFLKEDIYEKVLMMRGKITKIFTEKVTHLITTEVGSAKYHVTINTFCDDLISIFLSKF